MADKENIGLYSNNLKVDIKKLKKADCLAQVFAMYVHYEKENPFKRCLEMIDKFYVELGKNKEHISLAVNGADIKRNEAEGKLSALLAIEEGGAIDGQLHNLRNFYRLGVRFMTLTWNFPNEIGYPNSILEHREKGLTEFGHEVMHEMNRLGMIIDVSHLSDGGFYDVARLSKKPFVATHSNARSLKDHSRNLTDDMIKVLAESGGVTGINFARAFLGDREISTVADMVRHIKHMRNIGGIDVIAIGGDLDGTSCTSEITDVGEMDKLRVALKNEGFTQDEIDKIFYKNALRVIDEVL